MTKAINDLSINILKIEMSKNSDEIKHHESMITQLNDQIKKHHKLVINYRESNVNLTKAINTLKDSR